MRATREWSNDLTLLCESCGYVVEGLPPAGHCPECGAPISGSLPDARTGSPWQRRRSPGAWVRTMWQFLLAPTPSFRRMSVGGGSAPWLLTLTLLASGALVALVPAARILRGRDPVVAWSPSSGVLAGEARPWLALLALVGVTLFLAAILWVLTWIEVQGIRFFHSRRGWRITRNLAWNVCAHAGVGWLLGCALLCVGWALIDLDFLLVGSGRPVSLRSRVGDWMALPAVLGFFAGMMVFEVRVYQGVRACRFANAPRAHPGASGTT